MWLRMPLPMALDHINLYLLEEDDGWWIIDTGIAIGPTQALWEQIFAESLGGKPVKAVLSTHYHPDHVGMAGWLCERWQAPFYMTQAEYLSGLAFSRMQPEHFSWSSERYLQRAGYAPEQVERARERFNGFGDYIKPMPTAYRRLVDGASLTIGGRRWRVVVGSGHCPEHACLYSETLNILISGDQVIPKITSNVSVMAGEPEANPLKDWLASHERFLDTLPADALVLPAHNAPFHGLHTRLRHLIEHHEEHLLALEEACVEAAPTAMELLPVLFKRPLDDSQLGLALGECVAHLNYLHQRGQLARELSGNGQYTYRSIDDTLRLRLRRNRAEPDDQAVLQV
ncbi:MAG: MBL fold metallo-hydrolase [Pseudomonadales bacterium]|nr:MBL fold metallo-hydrolase [Pseudomonadales bacterium]